MNTQISNLISKATIAASLLFSVTACETEEKVKIGTSLEIGLEHSRINPTSHNEVEILDEEGEKTAFSLSTAEIMVRHIELDLPEGSSCEEQQDMIQNAICENNTITIEGPMIIDLVNGVSTPDLSEVQIPAGKYKRVDIRIDDADEDDGLVEGDPLEGYSMNVSAIFNSDEGAVDLELRLKFNEDIRFESDEGVEISGQGGTLLANLDPSSWFDANVLNDCISEGDLVEEDGVIFIDDEDQSNDCSDIENSIKDNIKKSGQLDRG